MNKDKKEKMLKKLKKIGKVTILVVFVALNTLMNPQINRKRFEPSDKVVMQPMQLLE